MRKNHYSKNKECIDCGKLITNNATRCISCAEKGNLNGSYIDNRTNKIYYCKYCNNEISRHPALYGQGGCKICSAIHANRTKEKYNCIDCSTEISYSSAKYGKCRCSSCAKKGKNHWNYIHGNGNKLYPPEFSKSLKAQIRKRDDYRCQGEECSMTEEEHLIVYGRNLEVHHIDYDKENCDKDNLTSLCKQCNNRINYNRKYWQEYFENKFLVSKE